MREIHPIKRKEPKKIEIQNSENVKQVLNLLNIMISGKRFGELDSAKQIYLLSCQEIISEMENGYYTDASLAFLTESIDEMIKILIKAKDEINKATENL